MKQLPNIAGALLGLAFITFGLNMFLHFMPMPPDPAPDSAPHKLFMAATFPTGFMSMVGFFQALGGLLVAVPKVRSIGLLILGPIVVNILAFHLFVKQDGITNPLLIVIALLSAFLLWSERKAFGGLIKA